MHDTALIAGNEFGKIYGKKGARVLDIGGLNINGSLREYFEKELQATFICVDIEAHPSVDIVVKPGDTLPFENESFDLIVSTSCFEHDPCFWMTFREMARIIKKNGYIYVNAPSFGNYHDHPGDNWRFYSDAGQALAYWSGRIFEGNSYPTRVEESFHILPLKDQWFDLVTIWKRVDTPETNIVLDYHKRHSVGPLKEALHTKNVRTMPLFFVGGNITA